MATIEKRERKTGMVYLADVRIKGFPRQKKTFKRLTDAKMWVQQTEAAIRKGEFQNVVKTANSKTLGDVIVRYRSDILPDKAESTQRAEQTYLNFWDRELGQYALSFIEADLIRKKMNELANAGDNRRKLDEGQKPNQPKSRKTLKHYQNMLELLFKYARAWSWTGASPTDGVKKITKFDNTNRWSYLTPEARKKLLEACMASTNQQLFPIVVFALATGARRGEILKLTFDDVDLKKGRAILRDTKNGETRSLPIVGQLMQVMEKHMDEVTGFYNELGYPVHPRWVFPRRNGMAPIDIRKAWENARDAAGLPEFRFHDLRHSAASTLAMKGANLLEIGDILGHKTLQMTKRYSHLSDRHKRELAETLSSELF